MGFLSDSERRFLTHFSGIGSCNPFLEERVEHEKALLGDHYVDQGVESLQDLLLVDPYARGQNFARISERAEATMDVLSDRLEGGATASREELVMYQEAALLLLYRRHLDGFTSLIRAAEEGGTSSVRGFFMRFGEEWAALLDLPGVEIPDRFGLSHVFACLYQIQRAYHHIFRFIIGQSPQTARLRAAVWDSIFTHDLRRYATTLYRRMTDMTTLVTGPSGTGKELVARAIGLSCYVPFDEASCSFRSSFVDAFQPLNLSALPSTLIESELFGHRKGAFTGAVSHRRGWLELCASTGSVFLDEIGELDAAVQVKLLRVLEARTFQALGDTTDLRFEGRIIAATNRDLAEEVGEGRFREDFYYRLCSNTIVTPSLREQLRDSPEVLGELLRFISARVTGEDGEELAEEVEHWIGDNLGDDYPWPGNIRELEQCVRSVLMRREYRPLDARSAGPRDAFGQEVMAGALTEDELLSRYCTLVYAEAGSYQEVARRLGIDRRTVKSRIDPQWLAELKGGA